MATTTRGRYSTRTRPTYGSYAGFSWGASPSAYGGTTSGNRKNNGRKNNARKSGTMNATAYRTCCNTFEQRIQSYKTLCAQTHGSGTYGCPSPTTLNSFANWINKGAIVQTVSPQQVARWARTANKNFNPNNPSPTVCKTVLWKKFGKTTIKAVARCKNGTFMVATTPTVNGRTFCFPH